MRKLVLVLPIIMAAACVSRPVPPTAPVEKAAATVLSPDCAVESFTIYFDEGVTIPGDQAEAVMDAVAKSYARCDLYRVEVMGHADASGDVLTNAKVSEARAQTVLSGLVSRGLLADKVKIRGYGETEALTDSGAEEPLNRKTEIRLVPEA